MHLTRLGAGLVLGLGMTATVVIGQQPFAAPDFADVQAVAEFKNGEKPVIDKASPNTTKANLDRIQRIVEWRATGVTVPDTWTKINEWINDFEAKQVLVRDTSRPVNPSTNEQDYIREFGKISVPVFKELLNDQNPIIRVNGMRMLASVGKSGYEDVADTYLEIINDPSSGDAVRVYALEGLRNLLAVPNAMFPERTIIIARDRQERVVQTLIDVLHRPASPKPDGNYSDDPKVVSFVRREGTRAMAALPFDVLRNIDGDVIARPGWELMRIAVRDISVAPASTPQEELDALIGFLTMHPDKTLNPDYAARLLYIALESLRLRLGEDDAAQTSMQVPPRVPWKIAGARLRIALEKWKQLLSDAPNLASPQLAMQMADLAIQEFAKPLETQGVKAQIDVTRFRNFEPMLQSQGPLYENAPETVAKWQ